MKALHMIAYILVWVGGINWGLVGLGGFMNADWNVVNWLFNMFWPMGAWIVYILVGLSAVYLLVTHKKYCKYCNAGGSMAM